MEFDVTEAEEHPPAFTETNNPIAILKRLRELGTLVWYCPQTGRFPKKKFLLQIHSLTAHFKKAWALFKVRTAIPVNY